MKVDSLGAILKPMHRRRDNCNPDSRRSRHGFDREPSPKRTRRNGKTDSEMLWENDNLIHGAHTDSYQNHFWLRDSILREYPPTNVPKAESYVSLKEFNKKPSRHNEAVRPISDPAESTQCRSYFQLDEHYNPIPVGRSIDQRKSTDHRRMDMPAERVARYATMYGLQQQQQQREVKCSAKEEDSSAWGHDGFHKMEAEGPTPESVARRKRPAFREKKMPLVEPVKPERATPKHPRESQSDEDAKAERETARRFELLAAANWGKTRGDAPPPPPFRGRFTVSNSSYYRRQGYRASGGTRGDKWKHDLFEEADRSSISRKNEEDSIALVEALLAS